MIAKDSLQQVKKDLESYIGQEVYIKANIGRNRQECKRGVMDSAFSNLFVIKDETNSQKTAYNYTDIITNSLQIMSYEGGPSLINCSFEGPAKYTRL